MSGVPPRAGNENIIDKLLTKPFIQHLREGGAFKALGESFVKPGYEFHNDMLGLHLKDRGFQIMVHSQSDWRKITKPEQKILRIVASA